MRKNLYAAVWTMGECITGILHTYELIICGLLVIKMRFSTSVAHFAPFLKRYPENPIAAGKVDAVIDCMFDIQAAIRPSIYETNAQRKVSYSSSHLQARVSRRRQADPGHFWTHLFWYQSSAPPPFVFADLSVSQPRVYTPRDLRWARHVSYDLVDVLQVS